MFLGPTRRVEPPTAERGTRSRSWENCQAEPGSKGLRDAEQLDRDLGSAWSTSIASEALLPVETRMRPLRPGEGSRRKTRAGSTAGFHLHLHPLLTQQLDALPPMQPPAPISPEHRGWTNGEGMQEHTNLARLFGGAALPLTLFPLRARAATAKTGRIDHPQASVSFPTPLMGTKRLPCWTAKRPIGLERKVLSREATRFPRRVAVAGGPYPATGADEAATSSVTGGMAGANSVTRRGVGSS
jgi:hypothetical protein